MVEHELELSNETRVVIPDLDSIVIQTMHNGQPLWIKWSPEFLRDLWTTVMLPGNINFRFVHAFSEYSHSEKGLMVIERGETCLRLTDHELNQIDELYRAVKTAYVIWRHEQHQKERDDGEE